MISFITFVFFGLGLIIGSFLNVVIFRLNTDRTFGGRSACMQCRRQLRWFELVPVFSFLALRGRCLSCKTKISFQYPAVELLTGMIFALLFLKFESAFFMSPFSFAILYAYYGTMCSLLVVVAVYDARHKIIPDALALLLGVLAFAGMFFFDTLDPRGVYVHLPTILEFLSGIMLAAPFAGLWLASRGTWMGLGDAKLAVGLGWLLGPSRLISAAVLAFWVGAAWGLALLGLSKKHTFKSELPFGPFLVLGTILSFLFELNIFPLAHF